MLTPTLTETRWQKDFERPIYELWKKKQLYRFITASKKKIFSIDTPPPYVNAPVHIGQATTYVLMDMFARFHRMLGDNVLFPLGLDRNGLPIEVAAEKRFGIKFNQVGREEFIKKCESILQESSLASVEAFLRSGISFNSWTVGKKPGDVYETDSTDYRALTQETFIDLWHKGLIYEDERINNYCPGCQTTLADAEITYEDLPTFFNDIIFTVKETGDQLIIGTTRPELVCTCGMVIFNPTDSRYAHLDGKTAVTPLFHKDVPLKAHPMAQMDKGTGLVMMCSAGDTSDIRFFRDMKLDPVIAIGTDGRMNEHAGFLKGLTVAEARQRMIEELKKSNLLVRQTKTTHRTPVCERSNDPIEFIAMSELYCKQVEFKENMRHIAQTVNFFAPESRQILLDWIDAVSIDWPISRRRYYATEVPLWYCDTCAHIIVPPKGTYYRPWKENPPLKSCPKCKGTKFTGDPRVFDTWFDSSISPLYILKYSRDPKFFEKNSPCTLRPQGKEIVRTWLYYTLLKDYLLTDKIIFRDAWINYHIVDEQGHKMSKSKGNVIDPRDVIDKFGAESFRLWAAVEGNLEKTDFRCSFDRIEGAGKTLTKLWNVARFISMFPSPKAKGRLTDLDTWILQEMNQLVKRARDSYARYDFHNPAIQLRHFLWETFASHYMELVKNRAYNEEKRFTKAEQTAAQYTLHRCLDLLLQLFAPIIPMITYSIYLELRKKDLHFLPFPSAEKETSLPFSTADLVELNGAIWKAKKDKGLSLKAEVNELVLDKKFISLKKDMERTHNVKKLSFGTFKAVF